MGRERRKVEEGANDLPRRRHGHGVDEAFDRCRKTDCSMQIISSWLAKSSGVRRQREQISQTSSLLRRLKGRIDPRPRNSSCLRRAAKRSKLYFHQDPDGQNSVEMLHVREMVPGVIQPVM